MEVAVYECETEPRADADAEQRRRGAERSRAERPGGQRGTKAQTPQSLKPAVPGLKKNDKR